MEARWKILFWAGAWVLEEEDAADGQKHLPGIGVLAQSRERKGGMVLELLDTPRGSLKTQKVFCVSFERRTRFYFVFKF